MKAFIYIFVLFLLVSSVSASIFNANFDVVDDSVVVEYTISFDSFTSVEFPLPSDFDALSVYVDGELIVPVVKDNVLFVNASDLSFNFVSSAFLDNNNFLLHLGIDFPVDDLVVKLVLPEGAVLKQPIKLGSGSIFPKPSKSSTDGLSLSFFWLDKDLVPGDEFSIFVQYRPESSNFSLILAFVGLLLVVFGLFFRRRVTIVERDIQRHLKPDEEQIVNVLKQKEGSCEQGTLRVVTGFSKATLSRLLKELEDRNIVIKEKRGKKNLVFLKK